MDIKKIPVGDAPESVNVIIEVSAGAAPVKYEFDKDSGAIFVDRFVHTPMHYPANYGFIPHTLSDDGDPVDVLVLAPESIIPGAVIAARPIGVLMMEDDGGMDEKVLAVPTDKMHPMYSDVKTHTDLPEIVLSQIAHFFEHYKDLEKGKWVKIMGWEGAEKAKQLITEGVERANG
ncbi:inorganic diphosphatase [Terasakiella sp. SH-1]|uniref:inorganic diphosphatase n=1 Tax=Terasakiella sp. SH-1 TaxID=2560057 RepID=UPI001073EAE6|nr:inorganic diphosphatase [Terasakiella sp. SH-1]